MGLLFVPAFAVLWLTLFVVGTIWETRAAQRGIREWSASVGLEVTRFGGGDFRLCPMSAGRATRIFHVSATFTGDLPVQGWVMCRSGGAVVKAVLSPPLPGRLTKAELNSLLNQGLPE